MSNLIVVIGLSGVGKSFLLNHLLLNNTHIKKLLSVTTRKKRKNERNNIDKVFLSKQEFDDYKINNKLVLCSYLYGIQTAYLADSFIDNENLICELHYNSYMEFKKKYQSCVSIYIYSNKLDTIKKNILNRQCSCQEKEMRINNLRDDFSNLELLQNQKGFFDYKFTNCFDRESKDRFLILIDEIIGGR